MLLCGVWHPAGLCSSGSDTPQNFVKQGIRSRRMLFCGVSDLAEQVSAIKCTPLCICSAGSDTLQDLVLWGLIPHRILFCGVWYPRRSLFCGASDPAGRSRPRGTRWKSFESLPFSLKGHFLKIVCMHKLHYPKHIGFMIKEPPIWKTVLCSAGSVTPQNNF
jgi:hypothetical protein